MANFDLERVLGRFAHYSYVSGKTSLSESLRSNQLKSKKWLVYEITKFKTEFKKVAVLGSWNSVLLYELMSDKAKVDSWDFFDLDQTAHDDRDQYFIHNQMKMNYNSFTLDVTQLFDKPEIAQSYDLIINPSCEHMTDLTAIEGPMYALTSNNYVTVKDHINTIGHHEDLVVKNGIKNVLYQGTLKLPNYERYCVIGYAK